MDAKWICGVVSIGFLPVACGNVTVTGANDAPLGGAAGSSSVTSSAPANGGSSNGHSASETGGTVATDRNSNSIGSNTVGGTSSTNPPTTLGGNSNKGSSASGGNQANGGNRNTGDTNAIGGTSTTSSANTDGSTVASSTAASSTQPYKGISSSTCDERTALKVSWYYNWTTKGDNCATGGEFIPMISGKNEKTTAAVTNAITAITNAGYKSVLGFNEPNKSDQANMTVAQVVELWPAMVANTDLRVGSPVTSADAKSFFTDFINQATEKNLRVDFIALHWYGWNAGSCNNVNELENYIKWAEGFEKPLWITEWGCMNQSNPNAEVVTAFYSQAIAMFQKHPLIERYAWYRWNTNNDLFDGSKVLNAFGTAYSAAPAYQ